VNFFLKLLSLKSNSVFRYNWINDSQINTEVALVGNGWATLNFWGLQTCKKLSFHAEFYSVKRRHSSVPTQPRHVQQRDIGETLLKIDEFSGIYRGAGSSHGADAPKAVAVAVAGRDGF
jgi:hypothetical protein